jgi:4'-phosphopantetheinyl transferase EntD
MSVSELDLGFRNNIPQQKWLFTAFSAKESVFKSLYPLIKSYFGFFEVEIISVYPFNQKEGTLKIKLSKYLSDLLQRFTIDCMYIHEGNFVHTLVIF